MNLKQINLFREMVRYFELSTNNNIDFVLSKVRYAKETLDDLEDKIPTERQLELESNIIDFKYYIKKNEHILETLKFDGENDGCSEINGICDYEHLIEEAEKELKEEYGKRVSS